MRSEDGSPREASASKKIALNYVPEIKILSTFFFILQCFFRLFSGSKDRLRIIVKQCFLNIDYYPTKYRRITENRPIGVTPSEGGVCITN